MQLKNIEENFEGPSWPNRIFFYFCILSSTLIIFMIIFCFFAALKVTFIPYNSPQYNTIQLNDMGFFDNERYLLSALVQSLAATIALVITLSLVAVQLAAQSYSARVIDVYKRNPDMWILLCIYIFTIFYGLGLTKIIGLGILGNYMEGAIFIAYLMGFFAFVCLVPYMLKTLDLLKPSKMIELLAEDITANSIIDASDKSKEGFENDPFLPLIDIMSSSIENNDNETAIICLSVIEKCTLGLFSTLKSIDSEDNKIAHRLMLHLECEGMYAINKNNEEILNSVTHTIEEIGDLTVQLELNKAENEAVIALQNIGIKAADQKLERTVKNTLFGLYNMGMKRLELNNKNADIMLFTGIGYVGITAAEQKLKDATHVAITSLGALLREARKHEKQTIVDEIKKDLQILEVKSKENNWNFIIPS
ncbi:DUF2254 family protein [Methanolobus sp. WCC1]|uniref:DUF2254 family protein n=1 Tax=unclassified Methanolobus TaxID=2629569 RepID=UPI00324AB12B